MSRAPADRVRPVFETAILLAGAAALALPVTASLAALSGLILLWLAARPPRQERVFVAVALTLSVASILASVIVRELREPEVADWVGEAEHGFEGLWDDLKTSAQRAAASFEQPLERHGPHLAEFETLERLVAESAAGTTLMLFDPDGLAVAWAGEGLLHEVDPLELASPGLAYRLGYSASTILAVEPVSDRPRPWLLIAGRSLANDRLPVATSALPRPEHLRWSLGAPDAAAPAGTLKLTPGSAPPVFVERPQGLGRRPRHLASLLHHLGVGFLGLTLLALVLLRATGGSLLPEGSRRRSPPGLSLLAVAGTAALAQAVQLQPPLVAALAASVGLATWGLLRRRPRSVRAGAGAAGGALALVGLALAGYLYQRSTGSKDLASSLTGSADAFALCLVGCFAALGLLILSARRGEPSDGDRAAWWGTASLLAAGATCDFPWISLPLLALAGAAISRWLSEVDFGRRPAALAGLLVLAALAGGVSWEIGFREVFRREVAQRYLPRVGPPTEGERNDIHLEVTDYFSQRQPGELLTPFPGPVDPRDLAFVLWRDSPLAKRDALSALAVETEDGRRSTFSFGLSLDDDLGFALPPERWTVPPVAPWQAGMIFDQVDLAVEGRRLATVRYWLLLRPGFRLAVSELAELEQALLRGGPGKRALDGLPRSVLYALYEPDGRAISSPWGEAPPLAPEWIGSDAPAGSVATPAGRCWFWRQAAEDGVRLLYLPQLTPRAGLERVGVLALGSLAWITAIALLALVFALPRSALADLFERTVLSYSKRMILVYVVLLLLPLIALNLVLMQSFVDRERSQRRANAQSALSSARLFLLDYLRGLEPGFDLETQVNRPLMEWISSVVDHPVNFYWGSRVYASSQQELFASGLLPRRIPGEVYSRLALRGYKMGLRRHAGGVGYLELYAPLDVDGASSAQLGFFLSVPLLEQEEEEGRELVALKRRAVLVTSALVILLVAVGSRLARGFTKPLMEIIAGTREIAAGAPFLEVTPREYELEALADAIDNMARRIAEGRRKLVLEKQVVERIVESITSGVVSLDHERRVLLQNRVAADRLGTEIGIGIEQALAGRPRLQPVLDFLAATGDGSAQATVELRQAGEVREWTLTWVPIPGTEDPAALLVVDDATEVLRGQRLEAWAEMARIIAHEIKNPLTPIRLSADHMRQVYHADRERFDEVFERCTDNILKQVAELSDIASDFSIYSRIPRAELAAGDLAGTLRELVDGYRDAGRSGVAIRFSADPGELAARFDGKLLSRAVRNVLENALRASQGRGEVEVMLDTVDAMARIRVVDSGSGVEPEALIRIFEPYFSTYDSGTGLGLAITRRIVVEHGGRIEARNRAGGGLEVTITIPLASSGAERIGDPRSPPR